MHVEISTSSRIDLWDLLGSSQGTQQHRELVECMSSKNLRNHESFRATAEEPSLQAGIAPQQRQAATSASLSIGNIRNGQELSSSKLPFLWKLHEMLDDVEKTGDDHIVSWLPHGRSFRVHKPKSFVQRIIPHYFKQSKYKSFQRQLHLYEFIRTPRGIEAGAYSHPKFIRGEKSLCLCLSPHKIKGKKNQRAAPVQVQGNASSGTVYPSVGKRLRAGNEFNYRGNTAVRNSTFSLSNLQCSNSSVSPPLHVPEGSFDWKQIQTILVTGASLAAELEKKTQPAGGPVAMKDPHSGDVVFAFGERPFCFIEDPSGKDDTLDSCCDEPDEVLLSDTELGCLIDESMDMRDDTRYREMII